MNTSSGQNDSNFGDIEKTFIEGSTPTPLPNVTRTNIKPGVRMTATNISKTNPYATKTSVPYQSTDSLPDGTQPIPIGSGTIVGVLGSGGMAKVYKIWNEKLEVFRAVKILIPTGQSDLKNRFDTEAKITAKLHHPNIVEIYNVGEWQGLPILEMEFIDGQSLESIIHTRGKIPDVVCAAIAIYIARALAYAHSQEFLIYGKTYHGVIHRDLKPANIMIASNGDVKLMDFGIARPTEASLHTVEGNIVGTMQYLSPEQLDGIDIDNRTDVYSFGAILYELLTGTKTFPQDTITNLMKKKILNDYRKFADFDFSITQSLVKITQKCLQLNKQDRYANIELLLRDLEDAYRSLTNEPPGKVLKSYIANPDSFTTKQGIKVGNWFKPLYIIPAGAVIAVGLLVTIFLVTGPKNQKTETPVQTTQNVPPADTAKQVDSAITTPSDTVAVVEQDVEPPKESIPVKKQSNNENSQTQKQIAQMSKPKNKGNVNTTPPVIETNTPSRSVSSPLDELKLKYGTDDLMSIGRVLIRNRAYRDAIIALEATEENGADANQRALLLLEAYVETGNTKDALYIINSKNIRDAQYDLLSGRIYSAIGKHNTALEHFQSAMTKPSASRTPMDIRGDALYYTAESWSNYYRTNPVSDVRFQALNAWNSVKMFYKNSPESSRFRKANQEMNSIQ